MQETKKHCSRTEQLVRSFLIILSLPENEKQKICIAARYHDIGKQRIPGNILHKPGKLTEEEFEIMKLHALYGKEMMENILPETVCNIILYHHENEDGSGYYHLCSQEIPLGSKIIHICDVYDALTNDRCYRKAWEKEKAIRYITEKEGSMFEKRLAETFCKIQQEHI